MKYTKSKCGICPLQLPHVANCTQSKAKCPFSIWSSNGLSLHFPWRNDSNEMCVANQKPNCRHPEVQSEWSHCSSRISWHAFFSWNASSAEAHAKQIPSTSTYALSCLRKRWQHTGKLKVLFNICCKQEVSGGMRCPSPFLGSSDFYSELQSRFYS